MKKFFAVTLAILLAGCATVEGLKEGLKKDLTPVARAPVREVRVSAPVAQVTEARKPAAARMVTKCDPVVSLWCGNLLDKVEDLKARSVTLKLPKGEHAFFFKKSTNVTYAGLLKAVKDGDKTLLPEDLEAFAQELRANGFPVPSSEGRTARVALVEFFENNKFREVACTPETMSKYALSYNNKERTKIDGYYQRRCAPGEKILELCTETLVAIDPPKPEPRAESSCERSKIAYWPWDFKKVSARFPKEAEDISRMAARDRGAPSDEKNRVTPAFKYGGKLRADKGLASTGLFTSSMDLEVHFVKIVGGVTTSISRIQSVTASGVHTFDLSAYDLSNQIVAVKVPERVGGKTTLWPTIQKGTSWIYIEGNFLKGECKPFNLHAFFE